MRPLFWVGSSKRDLLDMPGDVQDVFGFALHLAQEGGKHSQAKPMKGFSGAGVLEVVEDHEGDTFRAVYTVKVWHGGVRVALFPEEVHERYRDVPARYRVDQIALEGRRGACQRCKEMIGIEESSGNVYADLGRRDAGEMLVKAQLAGKIGDIIKARRLTQLQAAQILAMPQPKVSEMLRGKFRGISEAKMMDCLSRLGHDVQIVVKTAPQSRREGRVDVVFG